MATYYGYDKRIATVGKPTQVDWGRIGKEYSDMLTKELTRREDLKAEIEKQHQADLETILDNPQGAHKGTNDGIAQFAEDLRAQAIEQNRLLKSGELTLKEYTLQRQNLMQDTNRIYDVTTKLQTKYAEILQRYREGKASAIELEEWENFGGMINFDTHTLYIDPLNGKVFLAELNEDGTINKNNLNTLETISNGMDQRYEKFDTNLWIASETKNIKTFKEIFADGSAVEDPRIMEDYERVKNSSVNLVLNNDKQVQSVLVDVLGGVVDSDGLPIEGKTYRYTSDRNEFENNNDGTLILKTYDENNSGMLNFEFTDDQKAAVQQYLNSQFEMAVGSVRKAAPKKKTKSAGGGLSGDELITQINIIASGSPDEVKIAEGIIKENYNEFDSKDKNRKKIHKISRTPSGYTVYFKDIYGNITPHTINIGEGTTQEQRIQALYEYLQPSQDEADAWGNVFPDWGGEITDISELEIDDYGGTVELSLVTPRSFDSLKTSADGATFNQVLDNTGNINGAANQISFLENFLNETLRRSQVDTNYLDFDISIEDDEEVIIRVNGTPISEFNWDRRGMFNWAEGDKNPEDIKGELFDAYSKIINLYNTGIETGTLTEGGNPGDAIFYNATSNNTNQSNDVNVTSSEDLKEQEKFLQPQLYQLDTPLDYRAWAQIVHGNTTYFTKWRDQYDQYVKNYQKGGIAKGDAIFSQ